MDRFIRALRKIPSLALLAAMSSSCIASEDAAEPLKEEQLAETESAVLLAAGEALMLAPNSQNAGYARVPVVADQMPQTGMTVSLWFNTAVANYSPLFTVFNNVSSQVDRRIYVHWGKVHATVRNNASSELETIIASTSATNADGQWHHVAHTLGAAGSKLYVDGELVASDSTVTASTFTDEAFIALGQGRGHSSPFVYLNGQLDEVRVYTSELTQSEIRGTLYQEIPGSAPNLFGYWRLNGSGVWDESPNGRNGSLYGNATQGSSGAPIYNKSLQFDGIDDFVGMNDRQALAGDITTQLTLEAWIYPTQNTEAVIALNEGRYAIKRKSNGAIAWAISNTSPGWTEQVSSLTAPLNKWTHVALVYDASLMRANLYVNGLAAPAVSAWGAITDYLPAYNDFRIGAREYCTAPCTGALFFEGRIDEVRVWNVARSQAAIQESMFKQLSGGTAGLKGYWTLNEAVGTIANDSTMSRSTGALMGGTAHDAGVRSPLIDEPYAFYNGHAYIFRTSGASWADAQSTCAAHGYSLVTINDAAEEAWLEAREDALSADSFWIGLNDRAAEGAWVWASGQPSGYSNWSPGEPNNMGDEDCAADHFYASGVWNDIPCAWSKPFICESP